MSGIFLALAGSLPTPKGQIAYTTAGTFSWTAPAGVTTVSVVAVGGGGAGIYGGPTYNGRFANGGNGGGLGWKNNITVTPGNSYTVVVGVGGVATQFGSIQAGDSYFINITTVKGGGAPIVTQGAAVRTAGGSYVGDGGGNGGAGGIELQDWSAASGGGAGGYSGNGGAGADSGGFSGTAGLGGGGGGGGSNAYTGANNTGYGGTGGGVGLLGQGSSGAGGGTTFATGMGIGGSGGTNGGTGRGAGAIVVGNEGTGEGGNYGGGGSGGYGAGGVGAVRIIWGGGRSFPSNAADV